MDFFNELDKEFAFTLDPCGDKSRVLKEDMITWDISDDGLSQSWQGHRVFCNPPYSLENFKIWCEKINREKDFAEVIVLLMPLRKCANKYFHDLILDYAELRVVKGRLDFYPLKNQDTATNPSGSAVCVLRNNGQPPQRLPRQTTRLHKSASRNGLNRFGAGFTTRRLGMSLKAGVSKAGISNSEGL